MQQITNVQTGTIPQARPVAAAKAKAETRLAYIDVIRMILIILVIMVHAAVTYGAFGDWTYHDRTLAEDEFTGILLSLFVFVCQSFFMGLFFFFSGYFTPGSYDHKGLARFWKDRLLRLAIPMVIYTWFLSRIPNYINDCGQRGRNPVLLAVQRPHLPDGGRWRPDLVPVRAAGLLHRLHTLAACVALAAPGPVLGEPAAGSGHKGFAGAGAWCSARRCLPSLS